MSRGILELANSPERHGSDHKARAPTPLWPSHCLALPVPSQAVCWTAAKSALGPELQLTLRAVVGKLCCTPESHGKFIRIQMPAPHPEEF